MRSKDCDSALMKDIHNVIIYLLLERCFINLEFFCIYTCIYIYIYEKNCEAVYFIEMLAVWCSNY